jgi:hypothetical protein
MFHKPLLQEIVKDFSALNSHIDLIIQFVRDITHVVRSNDVNVIQRFPTTVNVETVDFKLFINVRSITLKYGTKTQFNIILFTLFIHMRQILHIESGE